jgi:hypothetical protein
MKMIMMCDSGNTAMMADRVWAAVKLHDEPLWRTCSWHFGVAHVGFADDALIKKQEQAFTDASWEPVPERYCDVICRGMGVPVCAFWEEGHELYTDCPNLQH